MKPATTWDDYIANAKALNSPPRRYGVVLALKSDMVNNEMHSAINTIGDGWFDKDWRPTFNDDRGVKAVETIKRARAVLACPASPPCTTTSTRSNMSQDIAAQGQQWATRCATMDNPDKSRVVGKINWTVMPEGGKQVMISDTYCISRFTGKDKDMLFRLLASALREENQRGAAALMMPPRNAVLERSGAAGEIPLVSGGVAMPGSGEAAAGAAGVLRGSEIINKRIVQAIVGQMETKAALDAAATEVQAMLAQRRLLQVRHSMWLFMLPSLVVMTVVLAYPLASAIYYSFLRYYLGGGAPQFIGLANYAELLADARFWGDLLNTVIIVGASVVCSWSSGWRWRWRSTRRHAACELISLLIFLPNIVTPVVGALFLRWIFIGRWGLLSATLIGLGIFPPDLLGNPVGRRVTVILADAWQFTPFMILVLYAGLNTVDQSQIEAAQIDGAGVWMLLFRIMLPSIRPLIVFVLAIRADGRVPLLRHDLRADLRRAGHRDRDDHALHLRARLPPAADRQGLGPRRADAADRRGADRGDDPPGLSARAGRVLMWPRHAHAAPLFLLLCALHRGEPDADRSGAF